mmetsp:Transcript_49904/g.118901  ORF Transcript_49904/g.118901 Transcript_49904/m.118901 type:complete len:158 (-) Transcript_49904:155-628(-)|eukprot:CAMPEP_0178452132 /NCGR_PEP_ID=MMETSP0689_2-20121128/44071_1 /TAXON_ID=160604 /ORGANISM="Amphidinium massartii, Strain CS-259" /LENGTH=157 /DNA_ID=CAMNT_0020077797 /DNA_START=113 /DNA_END=586 /DNA_ORIENTATION=+
MAELVPVLAQEIVPALAPMAPSAVRYGVRAARQLSRQVAERSSPEEKARLDMAVAGLCSDHGIFSDDLKHGDLGRLPQGTKTSLQQLLDTAAAECRRLSLPEAQQDLQLFSMSPTQKIRHVEDLRAQLQREFKSAQSEMQRRQARRSVCDHLCCGFD